MSSEFGVESLELESSKTHHASRITDNEFITVAVAGNPNSGKSTLINAITGSRLHVGNWPGLTVEKKSAVFEYEGTKMLLEM